MTSFSLEFIRQLVQELAPLLVTLLRLTCALSVTVHALLNKRHVHTAIGWIALAWLAPFLGALFYLMLGVNRIKRAGVALRLKGTGQGGAADLIKGAEVACLPA